MSQRASPTFLFCREKSPRIFWHHPPANPGRKILSKTQSTRGRDASARLAMALHKKGSVCRRGPAQHTGIIFEAIHDQVSFKTKQRIRLQYPPVVASRCWIRRYTQDGREYEACGLKRRGTPYAHMVKLLWHDNEVNTSDS